MRVQWIQSIFLLHYFLFFFFCVAFHLATSWPVDGRAAARWSERMSNAYYLRCICLCCSVRIMHISAARNPVTAHLCIAQIGTLHVYSVGICSFIYSIYCWFGTYQSLVEQCEKCTFNEWNLYNIYICILYWRGRFYTQINNKQNLYIMLMCYVCDCEKVK